MVTNGRGVIYEGAFGTRDLAKGPAMTPDTIFRLASMTKAVTSVAAMQLVEQGLLSLDQPIGNVLPELRRPRYSTGSTDDGKPKLRPGKAAITLRHLLTHTAGFGYEVWDASLVRYVKATGSLNRNSQARVVAAAAGVRSRRALGIRHQHRLGRPCRRDCQRRAARGFISGSISSGRWA